MQNFLFPIQELLQRMDLESCWYAYQCNSGEVLFHYNTVSGEHKWAVHFCSCLKPKANNSQSEPCCTWHPMKATSSNNGKFVRSIGTETEDLYFSNSLANDHQNALTTNTSERAEISVEYSISEGKINDNDRAETSRSTYSLPDEPVEVVLNDPFLPDDEKHPMLSKRLTLKLTNMSSHDFSFSSCHDSAPSKIADARSQNTVSKNNPHIENKSIQNDLPSEECEELGSTNVLQDCDASLSVSSFCVNDDFQEVTDENNLKRSKGSTSSRKNPEPRKLMKRFDSHSINDAGGEDKQDDPDNEDYWIQDMKERHFGDSEKDESTNSFVVIKAEQHSSSMVKEDFQEITEEDLEHASSSMLHINDDSQENTEEYFTTVCELCKKDCGTPSELTNHLMKHQPSGTKCPICNKHFSRRQGLRYHVQTHSGDKPHICRLCEKSFTKSASLVAHIRTHSGIKPFVCPKCNKGFTHSSNLSSHLRTHSSLRPYCCKFCDKGFKTSSHLTLHLRCHSNERPYKCLECDKAFKNSSHLKSHKKLHLMNQ